MKAARWGLVWALLSVVMLGAPARGGDGEPSEKLSLRSIGPAAGGRVTRVAGVAGDPLVYYAATASGGVWKSVNGGIEWKPIFDDQPVSSVGSIAVAPSDPNVVYAGAGEANVRGNVAEGNGIYVSTDAGATWSHVWKSEGQIGTMAVHPERSEIAFAAVLGSPFGPGPERGVYRTTDGGATWQRVLHHDSETGASDVCFDPSNPRVLFAGLWQVRRSPWGLTSGGPGSGLYRSRDGGASWQQLSGAGLPDGVWGKVGVRVAPSRPGLVYALIEAEEGGLFRSADGGDSWERMSSSRGLRQRAWYYSTLTIDPGNEQVIWFPQVPMLKTIDGGRTIRNVKGGGWDYHDVWIDPADTRRMLVGSDAGVSLSWDGGESWRRPALPISQLYHVNTDSREPYRVMGTLQDWGTLSGPSNSLHRGGVLLSDWHGVGGGEAGHIAADPADPEVVWAGEYLGFISRYDGRTGRAPHVGIYPENGSGHGAGDLRHRFQWTAPIVVSRHDPETVYHAGNRLFRTRDRGQSWAAVSPDLTRDDKPKQAWSGGPITGDNTGVEFYGTIFAVAESPLDPAVIWAGSDDGLVHVTRDGGESWTEVTPPGVPEWATVANIEASRWDAATAYVVADAHRLDDETPYLWKTTDHGRSWRSLAGGLDPEIYLHVVREDSETREMLYLGTERGVRYSRDGGRSWRELDYDLPTVAVHDLRVHGDDLVVGTMGRSIWILDDLTPLRELSTADLEAAPAHLFQPRDSIRWHYAAAPAGSDEGAGANPPRGAGFAYYLKDEPEAEITVEVVDAAGEVIRTLSSVPRPTPIGEDHPDWWPETRNRAELTTRAGLNTAAWDWTWDGAREIPGAVIDIGDPRRGPLALPGDYVLRLRVGEATYSRPLTVLPDPREPFAEEPARAQLAFNLRLRDQMSEIAGAVEKIRAVRAQLESLGERLGASEETGDLGAISAEIVEELGRIEERLHNPHAEVSYDILAGRHGGAQLYSRLSWLYEGARDHLGPPTQGMMEVGEELTAELEARQDELRRVFEERLGDFNRRAAERQIPHVAAGPV